MDLASLIGLGAGVIVVVFGIISGDQGPSALGNFWDLPSFFITLGGSLTCLLTMNSIQSYISGLKSITLAIKAQTINEGETIKKIIDLSNIARKEGLLQLEEAAGELNDQFMKKGVLLIVDGTDPDLVRAILETELTCVEGRHKGVINFWLDWAAMGPAWGMIGTLIGLINMLKTLSDISTVGPNMAVALVTTFYGSVLANWVATPCATKLKANNDKEVTLRNIMVEGLLSIQAGENPRVIEEKLKSFLSPKDRGEIGENEGGEA